LEKAKRASDLNYLAVFFPIESSMIPQHRIYLLTSYLYQNTLKFRISNWYINI